MLKKYCDNNKNYDKQKYTTYIKEKMRTFIYLSLLTVFLCFSLSTNIIARENWQDGIVKWFNAKAGYGQIISQQEEDIFVHHSVIEGSQKKLMTNQRVQYQAIKEHGRLKAIKVKIIN
jgi:CspA family cold shock protein